MAKEKTIQYLKAFHFEIILTYFIITGYKTAFHFEMLLNFKFSQIIN